MSNVDLNDGTRDRMRAQAITVLDNALSLHAAIQASNVFLGDNTNAYQANWKAALEDLLKDNQADFDFFDLLS